MLNRLLLRGRMRPPVLLLAAALSLPALTVASIATDDFFESDLDGNWAGTVQVAGDTLPAQLNLNVEDGAGVAFVLLGTVDGGELTGVVVFEASVASADADSATLTFDDSDPLARSVPRTLTLDYDSVKDELVGDADPGNGQVRLARTESGAPLTMVWTGTVSVDGDKQTLALALEQSGAGGRFAADPVTGFGWLGAEFGPLDNGLLNGKTFTGTLDLTTDVQLNLKLKKRNLLLKGRFTRAGKSSKATLRAAASTAKKLKVKKATPTEVTAGETTTVTLKSKNALAGAVVHSDDASVAITSVQTGKKSIAVGVRPDASVADGTRIGVRVVNIDGQIADKAKLLTVTGGGGGGATVSFAAQIQPIFNDNCALAGCHAAGSGAGGLVLAEGQAYGNTVNVPSSEQPSLFRVKPGSPDDSYLVRKIRGDSSISGGRMPLNRPPLDDSLINLIVTWVSEGAQNNRVGGR